MYIYINNMPLIKYTFDIRYEIKIWVSFYHHPRDDLSILRNEILSDARS